MLKINNTLNFGDIKNFTHKIQDEQYIKLDYQDLDIYNSILIKAFCGAGKTSNTAKIFKEYNDKNTAKIFKEYNDKNQNQLKIMTIGNLRTLINQHISTFEKEGIKLLNYRTSKANDLMNGNFSICMNSLYKISSISNDALTNYIVYIDEINSFLKSLTHNEKLNDNIKIVYTTLMRIIKHCKCVIVSDAIISDSVKIFLRNKMKIGKTLFIENTKKRFVGVDAINENDENEFLQKVINQVKNKEYFLFASDNKEKITLFYAKIIGLFPEQKSNCILITADSQFKITDATTQFYQKYVFYSPSIITGVDFTIKDKQNVYLYFQGNSINPDDYFQQCCRTRNINKIYYYLQENESEPRFTDIKDLKTHYKKISNINSLLLNVSTNLNDEDEIVVNDNIYFDTYCFNEFQNNIYATNKKQYFEEILDLNGITYTRTATIKKLSYDCVEEMGENVIKMKNELVEEYINSKSDDKFLNIKFESIFKYINTLHLLSDAEIRKYTHFITDSRLIDNYFSTLLLFKTDDYINNILEKETKNIYEIKQFQTTINKIKLISKLEKFYSITRFNLDFSKATFKDKVFKEFDIINEAFRIEKKQPKNIKELSELYYIMIKNITGIKLNLIKTSRPRIQGIKTTKYDINNETIDLIFTLTKLNPLAFKNYNTDLLKSLNISIELDLTRTIDEGEELFENNYLFGKKYNKK